MKIIRYDQAYEYDCLRIFRSNIGTFFAAWEAGPYESYLKRYASKLPYFVVLANKEVVACGGYAQEKGTATLSWGMVDSSHQGKSIGKRLLFYRLKTLYHDLGNIPLVIDTSQKTQGFYEKYGFIPTKVEQNGYEDGLDKVYMRYAGNLKLAALRK